MVRRRKIPVRKHHGVRDPLKQQEEREKKLKNIVNGPPEKGGDQKVSNKFAQFQKLVDNAKSGKKFKRIHSGQEDKPAVKVAKSGTNTDRKIRNIKQLVDETDEDYLKRVNRITSQSLKEAQYEAKYGVNVIRDPKTGAITVKKRPKNEIDELLKQKQKEKLVGKMGRKGKMKPVKPIKPMDPTVAKALIKQAIREDEEEKKQEVKQHEEYKRDVIKFGEIVHAPPTLSTPRKAQKSETVPRPGKKNNLLLKTLLNENDASAEEKPAVSSSKVKKLTSKTPTKAQLKGKRRELPAATRSMLENERDKLVELYRNMKKSKEKPFPK